MRFSLSKISLFLEKSKGSEFKIVLKEKENRLKQNKETAFLWIKNIQLFNEASS